MYSLQRTAAPAVEPVTLDQVKAQCRLDQLDTSQDALLAVYVQAAREYVEEQTGRSLIEQTWTLTRDRFPGVFPYRLLSPWNVALSDSPGIFGSIAKLPLPRGAVLAITSVKYFDPYNGPQTLDPSAYTVSLAGQPTCLEPVYGSWWPATAVRPDAVQVKYTAGYGPSAVSVPATLQLAMLLLVGHWYENREATQAALTGNGPMPLPLGVDAMLAPYTDTCLTYEAA